VPQGPRARIIIAGLDLAIHPSL